MASPKEAGISIHISPEIIQQLMGQMGGKGTEVPGQAQPPGPPNSPQSMLGAAPKPAGKPSLAGGAR
jgi:hypothetical protein